MMLSQERGGRQILLTEFMGSVARKLQRTLAKNYENLMIVVLIASVARPLFFQC